MTRDPPALFPREKPDGFKGRRRDTLGDFGVPAPHLNKNKTK